jgi:hypothetical protein
MRFIQRNHRLSVRLSEEEKTHVERLTLETGFDPGQLVRAAIREFGQRHGVPYGPSPSLPPAQVQPEREAR